MIDTHAHANERVFKLRSIAAYKCIKLIQLECLKIMFTKSLKSLFDTDLTRPAVKQYKPKTTIICIIQWGQSIPQTSENRANHAHTKIYGKLFIFS